MQREDEDGVACAWVAHLGDQVGRDDAGPARSAERAASAERDVLLAVDGVDFPGSDVLHLGDVFQTVAFPVIDRNNGGTLDGTIEALGIAAGIAGPDTMIVPGHGVVSGRADVIEFRDMVIAVKAKVEGGSYDDVVAAGPTARVRSQVGRPGAVPHRRLRRARGGLTAGSRAPVRLVPPTAIR